MNRRNVSGLVCGLGLLGGLVGVAVAADGDAVAIVNGRPVSKSKLNDVLKDAYGLQVMQQLIVLELVRAETRRLNIHVTEADVDQEYQRALARIAPPAREDGQPVSEAEQRQALDYLLREKNISFTEFMIGMERNAHLRKIVERDFRVDDATLREEFARTYGEKVEVRHIQVDDVHSLHEALGQLQDGADFAEVARQTSKNAETAPRGGLLAPFTFKDEELAPAIREAAFALQVGEVSKPIRVGRWWHILKLERRLPPADAEFGSVRDEVERSLRDRVIPERMNALVTELYERADIRVLDRQLEREYKKMLEENRAAPSP